MICILAVLLALLMLPTACTGNEKTAFKETVFMGEAKETVQLAVLAMGRVKSFALETDVTDRYELLDPPTSSPTTYEWKGTKLVDVASQRMKMDTSISMGTAYSLVMYFWDGWRYYREPLGGRSQNPWLRTRLTEAMWSSETQMPEYVELLRSATEAQKLGTENVNGTECLVLDMTPSAKAMVAWAVSQEQPFGPQIDVMNGGGTPVVRPDAYQGGSLRLWIDKGNLLPVRVKIDVTFQGFAGGGVITSTPYTPKTNPVRSTFSGEGTFSGYDLPVSIVLPAEAVDAREGY